MTIYFATVFDSNYLTRALVLYDSIERYHDDFILYVICLDEGVYKYFSILNVNNIKLIRLAELEEYYPELLKVKSKRKIVDYIFTLSPYYPSYILDHDPKIPFICSLDADQFFFSNSEEVFADLRNCSVLIMPHRFPEKLKNREKYGKYNVSFQVFKNDKYGKACLKLWRDQCLEWCEDKLDGDRYADQKYLDSWQMIFGNEVVREISNPGVGLAPWNIENCHIHLKNGAVFVNGLKLVLFHYQGLRFVSDKLINSGIKVYGLKSNFIVTGFIFKPIIRQLFRRRLSDSIDNVCRIYYPEEKVAFKRIDSHGMFYVLLDTPINVDFVYKINMKIKGFDGLLNRFKSLYR